MQRAPSRVLNAEHALGAASTSIRPCAAPAGAFPALHKAGLFHCRCITSPRFPTYVTRGGHGGVRWELGGPVDPDGCFFGNTSTSILQKGLMKIFWSSCSPSRGLPISTNEI